MLPLHRARVATILLLLLLLLLKKVVLGQLLFDLHLLLLVHDVSIRCLALRIYLYLQLLHLVWSFIWVFGMGALGKRAIASYVVI